MSAWRRRGTILTERRFRIAPFVGKHYNETIHVLGNGPSLLDADLSAVVQGVSIGTNRIHLLEQCNDTIPGGWVPNYAIWADSFVVDESPEDHLHDCDATFVELERLDSRPGAIGPQDWHNLVGWRANWLDLAEEEVPYLARNHYPGWLLCPDSITVAAVHLAIVMGASRVEVWGVDHRRDDRGRSHFYDRPAELAFSVTIPSWVRFAGTWLGLADKWPVEVVDQSPYLGISQLPPAR